MDNRLIFLYQSLMFERWGDAGGYERMLMDMHVQAIRQGSRQIRFPKRMKRDADRKQVEKLTDPHCQEKPLQEKYRPYRKPTQVGEERILR